MKMICPRSYTPDCNASKCSHWGTSECVDGKVEVTMKSSGDKKLPCPRAYSSDCNGGNCKLWGTPECESGYVNMSFDL